MRGFVFIPLCVAIVAAVGLALCKAAGWDPGFSGLIFAAISCVIAGEMAFVPLLLVRGGSPAALAQAGLVGTMVHLFIAAIAAAAVLIMKVEVSGSFVYWLLAFYWTTLAVLVCSFTRTLRIAPNKQ